MTETPAPKTASMASVKQVTKPLDASMLLRFKNKNKPVESVKLAPATETPAPKHEVLKKDEVKWQAHNIETPLDLLLAHRIDKTPYRWQAETLFQLAGFDPTDLNKPRSKPTDKCPFYYSLVAANGSGKDQIVIASFATWFAMTKIRSRCIITSSSYEQLKDQTFKYIKTLCEDINIFHGRKVFEIVEFFIICNDTGSEIKCFVTDDPGKAEGRHPFDDYPNAEMAVIVNEAKSITDELFQAFSRFTGYNYWLEISSPGPTSGHFYKRFTICEHSWPAPFVLGEFYGRKISAFECDHLKGRHIDNLKKEYGENSLLYRSQVLAEFTTIDEASFISSVMFENYPILPAKSFGLANRGGIDLSLGGDEMVGYFFVNGKLHMRAARHKRESLVKTQVISWLKEFNIAPNELRVDDGGLGRPILQSIQDQGYDIIPIRNESRASNPNFFRNRGVENWARIKRALEDKVFPNISDEKTIKQLSMRGYSVTGIVTKLESKKEMKSRGLDSPDRADALALCFDGVPFGAFKDAATIENGEPLGRFDELLSFGKSRLLTKSENAELSVLFSYASEARRPAQHSLTGIEPTKQNRGLFHEHITT